MRGETGFEADEDEEDTEPVPPLGVADMGIGPGEDIREERGGEVALWTVLLGKTVFMVFV